MTEKQKKTYVRDAKKKQYARFKGVQKDIPAFPSLEQLLWLFNCSTTEDR